MKPVRPDDAREAARLGLQTSMTPWVYRLADALEETQAVLYQVVARYDGRRSTRWGRFLLWLLRKTT